MTQTLEKVGDTYLEFKLKKKIPIKELQLDLKVIEHTPTGAEIIHLENDDEENVFCLALRTLPDSSNGVAHILEHTVLCGSKKFPVKDPFFSMNRRSLNTYMNALTAPDFTCYPAASQVEKDFYNLLEVYLDAVFHPELKELSFLQEGHRVEFSVMDDPKTPLTFKGIVYNEMKGALSSPISRLWQAIMASLFPDLLYKHNFGGEPKDIPRLTYQELLAFHKQFYQKSRCTFCFYGNIPTKKHLDFLLEHSLKGAESLPKLPYNEAQKRFSSPKEETLPYPVAAHEDTSRKTYLALSWLTTKLTDEIETLALHILDTIIMGTDAAPLKYTLLNSKLCHSVFSNFEDELSEIPYSIIFEGCREEDTQALKELTLKSLRELSEQTVPEDLIDAALHQLEFTRTEISSDYGPFGLSLILKLVPGLNVGAKYENSLKIHSLFDELKEHLRDPNYLPGLIKKHFVDNTHFSVICMVPDKKLSKKEDDEEKETLQKLKDKLDDTLKKKIVAKAEELQNFQNLQEYQSLEVLPKVTLKDVSIEPKKFHLREEKKGTSTLFHHDCFTNNITYLDLALKLPKIEFEDLPYARLFAYLLPQMGTSKRDYKDVLQFIQGHTGGVYSFIDTFISVKNIDDFSPRLVLQGKALGHEAPRLVEILHELATEPSFENKERLKELLSQHFIELDQDLKQSSLRYATNLSYAGFSKQSYVSYFWFGLGYYHKIKKLHHNFDDEYPALIEKLNQFKAMLLHGHDPHIICSATHDAYHKLDLSPLTRLDEKAYTPFDTQFNPQKVVSQGRISSSSVFFTSMSIATRGFQAADTPLLSVAAKLFDNTVLHQLIREQGGAYGGGSNNRPGSGKFSFYAYRDPNLSKTVEAFYKAAEDIAAGKFSERELEEAKLGMVQKLDHPIVPEYRAYTAYTWLQEGKTESLRRKVREKILFAKRDQIKKAVDHEILAHMKDAVIVSFGSKEKLEDENKKLKAKKLPELVLKSLDSESI